MRRASPATVNNLGSPRLVFLAIGALAASCLLGCSSTGSDPDSCEFGDGVPATLKVVDAQNGSAVTPRFTEHGASIAADCADAIDDLAACKSFDLDLDPGHHEVTVSAIGHLPDRVELDVQAPVGCSTDTARATVELFER
jgi:hypothetical protein